MANRKPLWIAAILVAFIAGFVALGQLWLTDSEPYRLGRAAVGAQLGVAPDTVALDRFAAFKFSDGSVAGHARFVLCGAGGKCYFVGAQKRDGRWSIIDLVER